MFRHLVRLVFSTIKMVWPWVGRFARMLFLLTITAVTSIYVGIPKAVVRIADSWISEATSAGLPVGYHPVLHKGALVVASITLVLGWLVLASFTVFVIKLIFFW